MAVFMKSIKPQRLKIAAFRLAWLNAMRKAGKVIKSDFEKTTKTWKHKPVFEIVISLTGPGPLLLVGTDDEIYGYVSRGTEEHPIFAGIFTGKSSKKSLAFPSKFSPKTKPGFIGSSPGSSGGSTVFVPYVNHPGSAARKFEEAIKKKRGPWFKKQMEQAMSEAARKSGYAL